MVALCICCWKKSNGVIPSSLSYYSANAFYSMGKRWGRWEKKPLFSIFPMQRFFSLSHSQYLVSLHLSLSSLSSNLFWSPPLQTWKWATWGASDPTVQTLSVSPLWFAPFIPFAPACPTNTPAFMSTIPLFLILLSHSEWSLSDGGSLLNHVSANVHLCDNSGWFHK